MRGWCEGVVGRDGGKGWCELVVAVDRSRVSSYNHLVAF